VSWSTVHSFFDGWGLQEVLPPENTEVLADHPDAPIPYKVVRRRREPRTVFADDAARLLGVDLFAAGTDPDRVYADLEPLLAEERRRRSARCRNLTFDRIVLPRIAAPRPER
jgi:hypothetical protein